MEDPGHTKFLAMKLGSKKPLNQIQCLIFSVYYIVTVHITIHLFLFLLLSARVSTTTTCSLLYFFIVSPKPIIINLVYCIILHMDVYFVKSNDFMLEIGPIPPRKTTKEVHAVL